MRAICEVPYRRSYLGQRHAPCREWRYRTFGGRGRDRKRVVRVSSRVEYLEAYTSRLRGDGCCGGILGRIAVGGNANGVDRVGDYPVTIAFRLRSQLARERTHPSASVRRDAAGDYS